MGNRVEISLTEDLLSTLQEEHYVTIATVDAETGAPTVNAISWIYAKDKQTVRFAIDCRSQIIKNIKEEPLVSMTVIAEGSTYSLSGRAKITAELIEDVPLKLSMIDLKVSEVKDVMFYGARLTAEPKFEKTYDEEAAAKLDKQVMNALMK
ncbi:pyridoxamine 5'-phosphate oxidase family protein [Alkalicoccus daliensis]|uniref:Pyridoxamine 5'-phosphate oxidase n=1 Tax=Alkalicoccus daliensis TaxID=745820 RepID=A0A1G9ZT94_9BACI|nr:pyridoxamine 5'-phosphate oxidase family protein [Alkalicoccus daliensis]SDN23913.1 Pyridoxamine 5'-phosphate oxidase [Alkalicoccus daliensis]